MKSHRCGLWEADGGQNPEVTCGEISIRRVEELITDYPASRPNILTAIRSLYFTLMPLYTVSNCLDLARSPVVEYPICGYPSVWILVSCGDGDRLASVCTVLRIR